LGEKENFSFGKLHPQKGVDFSGFFKGKKIGIEVKTSNGPGGQNSSAGCYAVIRLATRNYDFGWVVLLSGFKQQQHKKWINGWPQEIVDEILVVENVFQKKYKTVFYNTSNIVYKSKDCFLKSLTKEINLFVDFMIAH
jgi:hypothetical protein